MLTLIGLQEGQIPSSCPPLLENSARALAVGSQSGGVLQGTSTAGHVSAGKQASGTRHAAIQPELRTLPAYAGGLWERHVQQ